MNGVVLSGTGGVWRVLGEDGVVREASLRGRLKKSDEGRRSDGSLRRDTVASESRRGKLAVGDRVTLAGDARESGAWAIDAIAPRTSKLARRSPGGGYGERVLAANVDQVVVVFAAARPEPHPRMLDRFLVVAEANAIAARVVVNKAELVGDGDAARGAAAVRERFADYERAGYPLHVTSVARRHGLEELREALAHDTSALTGPSGVGKSSLMNALFPGLSLRVGAISESVNKGRHTTVGALLHPLPGVPPGEGFVVDTPGLREIGFWGLTADELDACFPEFRPHLEQCRFADCAHVAEPGCAVRDAVAAGGVSPARYDSYVKLREEILEGTPPEWA
ncbi:ribosome small subunit-dependent GTPase A [Roseisolibacter sp. H3M3-2]|uniref:ribosome small subunit-dependent GTPase A n=1 Tax=Roseisolibacter sp. H3M3-2 TaxID=3031323 RepID=UPI0023DCA45B|nr:ribosome small subunit-dependent GTPase A [Roseisolibacter sp. H3M3-2]MDF1504738.1 ribosome small subunit-dependent GTPase A [Roseisolibacter sp. H3M3-2]